MMTKAATEKLFVNLSASKARKRLKSYGFGVQSVEAAGWNQAFFYPPVLGQYFGSTCEENCLVIYKP